MNIDQSTNLKSKVCWFHLTSGKLLVVLLALEVFLLLSERFQWFSFNEKKGYTVLIAIASVGVTMMFMLLWFILALLFRWHFQFSIRSLLVLTIVVAIPCSWLAVELKWAREQKEAVEAIRKAGGGFVLYDFSYNGFDISGILIFFRNSTVRATDGTDSPVTSIPVTGNGPASPIWLWNLLGHDFFHDVTAVYVNSDKGLGYLDDLPRLQSLYISSHTNSSDITDRGLEQIKGLTNLKNLVLKNTNVTDAGIKDIQKALPNLKIFRKQDFTVPDDK
jgi:hypothetical protein